MLRHSAYLEAMVEEIQTYVNRMEASLGDTWDMHYQQDQLKEAKDTRRALDKENKLITQELDAAKELLEQLEASIEEFDDVSDEDEEV